MQPIFSIRASLSASSPLTVEGAIRKPDPRPHSLLRMALLLGVGLLAVSLLSPATAWAKGAAASTQSYSFPAAVRGAVLTTSSVHPMHVSQAVLKAFAVCLMFPV